jgi:alpha-glucosidase (family GH31 glycosyl hydrolase)
VRLLSVVIAAVLAAPAGAAVRDGETRYEVLSPTLIRIRQAPFDAAPTMLTGKAPRERARYTTRRSKAGERVIRTRRITLRRRGDGAMSVRIGRRILYPRPGPNPAPLGGWRRSLDLASGKVPLHEGVLSRAGWALIEDGRDQYLFAYGNDYARALRDLRTLTGPAPLLPRKAFGVWFSRWWPYSAEDWKGVAARFDQERIPLDVISLDTDFKRVHDPAGAAIAAAVVGAEGKPYSWNGWDWNRDLYPDPKAFLDWAHGRGIEVGLNVHPSISTTDPRYPEMPPLTEDPGCRIVQADPGGTCQVFDWSDPAQLAAYLKLHEPFERDGADFWWLDWCCDGSRASAPGVTPDTVINRAYAERQRARGERWPAFSRIGGSFQAGFAGAVGTGALAEHRYTLQFTGDTCGTWPLIAFAAEYTASAAAIGMPFVSHDTGSFHGVSDEGICDQTVSPYLSGRFNDIPPEMYVRWVQLGTFQPLLRLHSHHGARLPWDYPGAAGEIAAGFLRLRAELGPYLYTLARESYDTGLPMARALWLTWPEREEAYEHASQYTLGRDVLVAPVSVPGDPATVTVWFPPGTWIDWFTGERHRGPAAVPLQVPLARMPVFVRAGAVIPLEGGPRAFPGTGDGTLYEDAGTGFGYQRGEFRRYRFVQRKGKVRRARIR